MDPRKGLEELDLILLIKGIKFYATSTSSRCLMYICRLLFVIHYISSLAILISQFKFEVESIFTLINIWFELNLFTMYVYFLMTRLQFKRLYEDMLSLCFVSQSKDIKRFLRFLAIAGVGYFVCFASAKTVVCLGIGTKQFLYSEYGMSVDQVSFGHRALALFAIMIFALFGWSTITALIYLLNVYLIKKMFEGFFEYARLSSCKTSHQLRMHWMQINRQKDRFESIANVFPFFWFANTFTKCTGAVVASKLGLQRSTSMDNEFIVLGNWINYGTDMIVEMATLAFIDHVNRRVRHLADNFQFAMLQSKNLDEDRQIEKLLYEVHRDAHLELTGWSFFELKRSLILSLIGAAIPFTVLFVQLIDPSQNSTSIN